MRLVWISIYLILSLVEVYSQTAPYVSFMGVSLPNHSYVDLTAVGNDTNATGNTVRCHTDLETCCQLLSPTGGNNGEWYFPNGSSLLGSDMGGDIYKLRGVQVVHIRRRNNAMSPTGIYQCDIETNAVNDDDVNTITEETIYVGLYLPDEGMIHFIMCR